MSMKEYRTIQEVAGPLMLVRDVEGVTYNEMGEIELPGGELRRCKVPFASTTWSWMNWPARNGSGAPSACSKPRCSTDAVIGRRYVRRSGMRVVTAAGGGQANGYTSGLALSGRHR